MLSDTRLVDIAAATQFILTALGVVMSLVTMTKRRHKAAAVAVFVVAGSVGFASVHLTAVSAERAKQAAESEQGQLQQQLQQMTGALAVLTSQQEAGTLRTLMAVSDLREQTEAWANRPGIPLEDPQEPPAKVTWQYAVVRQLPEDRRPAPGHFRHAMKVTLEVDKDLIQPEFRFACTSPIDDVECWAPKGGRYNASELGRPSITIELDSPKLSPRQPWTFVLYSTKFLWVESVEMIGGAEQP